MSSHPLDSREALRADHFRLTVIATGIALAFAAWWIVAGIEMQSRSLWQAGLVVIVHCAINLPLVWLAKPSQRSNAAMFNAVSLCATSLGLARVLPFCVLPWALGPFFAFVSALPNVSGRALGRLGGICALASGAAICIAFSSTGRDDVPLRIQQGLSWSMIVAGLTMLYLSLWLFSTRLHDAVEREASARRAGEDILTIVSHDLRNPLQVVRLAAGALADGSPPTRTTSDVQRRGRAILRGATVMERIIQDLLDIASIDAGRLSVSQARHDVGEIFTEIGEIFAPLAAERALRLVVRWPDESLVLACDRTRIMQLLSNLVGNALKFSPNGEEVAVSASRQAGLLVVSVRDQGPGITLENQRRVFERYWQEKNVPRGGLGLGLAIARFIVEAHGGVIGVRSRPGEGAEFWFQLPLEGMPPRPPLSVPSIAAT